jgi:hypothetical protein
MIRLPRRAVWYALPVALPVAALLVCAAPASADAPVADLDCTITVTSEFHPGLTPRLQHIAVIASGTADCTGTIDGEPVTGPGAFRINDVILARCGEITGSGTFVLKIPTASGTQTVTGRTTIALVGGEVVHSGDLTGTATTTSVVGDCVNTPITSATSVLSVHVT